MDSDPFCGHVLRASSLSPRPGLKGPNCSALSATMPGFTARQTRPLQFDEQTMSGRLGDPQRTCDLGGPPISWSAIKRGYRLPDNTCDRSDLARILGGGRAAHMATSMAIARPDRHATSCCVDTLPWCVWAWARRVGSREPSG